MWQGYLRLKAELYEWKLEKSWRNPFSGTVDEDLTEVSVDVVEVFWSSSASISGNFFATKQGLIIPTMKIVSLNKTFGVSPSMTSTLILKMLPFYLKKHLNIPIVLTKDLSKFSLELFILILHLERVFCICEC